MFWTFIKNVAVPGSLPFLVLALGVGALMLRAHRRVASAWLVGVTSLYLVLSFPPVADRLARGLDIAEPLSRADRLPQPIALIVIGGDYEARRVDEAARLFRRMGGPLFVLSGDESMREAAIAAGIPADRILWEKAARTTREQATAIATMLRARGVRHIVLVASSIHMRRALPTFRAAGFDPIPAPSGVKADWPSSGVLRYLPRWSALQLSANAVYEYLAWELYRARGWVRGDEEVRSAQCEVLSAEC